MSQEKGTTKDTYQGGAAPVGFTPGPWHAAGPLVDLSPSAETFGRHDWCEAPGQTYGEQCANARLMASAPDLLAALIEALPWLDRDAHIDVTAQVHAAIAKATDL